MLLNNELFVTADGSHSLRSEHFGVPYHSVHGALQESRHVFIEAGLRPLLDGGKPTIDVLEMGLGTGLNLALTYLEALRLPDVRFGYEAYERYPITPARAGELNYRTLLPQAAPVLKRVHDLDWGKATKLAPNFTFVKQQADFLAAEQRSYPPASFDVLYYDAFAPASQPELWTPAALAVCYAALRSGGVFVTYCAKGQFKRDLRDAGFTTEPLPGPPGKREMTRGRKSH